MRIVDCHTHTCFSDGESTFEENVRAAVDAGCSVLVSTDHLTLPASMESVAECQVPLDQLAAHRAAFRVARALAAELDPELELVYGFECDWYPGCEDNVGRWSKGAVVRLGSVHWIGDAGDVAAGATGAPGTESVVLAGQPGSDAGWIDYSEDRHVWEELGPDGVWQRYVDAWCSACESSLAFDVMAHPDLCRRFENEGLAPTRDVRPLWDQMAACAHDTGRRVEVSTGGLRKSVGDCYPELGLLERFCAAGVPVTFGSDAHRARDVCWGLDRATARAWEAGYRSFDVPHADGSWEMCPIE